MQSRDYRSACPCTRARFSASSSFRARPRIGYLPALSDRGDISQLVSVTELAADACLREICSLLHQNSFRIL